MTRYLIQRFLIMVVMLAGLSIIVFITIELPPGDPGIAPHRHSGPLAGARRIRRRQGGGDPGWPAGVAHDVAEAVTLADRVLVIEDGRISLDLAVDLPRPRERGSPEIAALEGRILRDLFKNSEAGEDA